MVRLARVSRTHISRYIRQTKAEDRGCNEQAMNGDLACRLGVDVGGTFTDLVLVTQDGRVVTRKVLSTSSNYAEAIFAGIAEVMQDGGVAGGDVKELIHATTVATNAIIERRGARTGLVTTEGFRDLLEIGRLRLMRL